MGKIISQIKTINTVISENMLDNLIKKGELTFQNQKAKLKLFKNFHFESFLGF